MEGVSVISKELDRFLPIFIRNDSHIVAIQLQEHLEPRLLKRQNCLDKYVPHSPACTGARRVL